jgi:hypothetical protein
MYYQGNSGKKERVRGEKNGKGLGSSVPVVGKEKKS